MHLTLRQPSRSTTPQRAADRCIRGKPCRKHIARPIARPDRNLIRRISRYPPINPHFVKAINLHYTRPFNISPARITSGTSAVFSVTSAIAHIRATKSPCIARGKGKPVLAYTHLCRPRGRGSRGVLYQPQPQRLVGRVNKSSLLSATSALSTQLDKLLLPRQTPTEGRTRPPSRRARARARSCFRLVPEIAIEGCRDGENFATHPTLADGSSRLLREVSPRGSGSRDPFVVIAHVQLHNWCVRRIAFRDGARPALIAAFLLRETLCFRRRTIFI